jgi:hypothetical protein
VAGALLAMLAVAGGSAWWTVTSSWFLEARAEPLLEHLLGGDVAIGRAAYAGHGQFVLDDIVVRVPGIDGPAGQLCRIQRANLTVSRLFQADRHVDYVELTDVLVRLSEDAQVPGEFNFVGLSPDWSGDSDYGAPPRVRINRTVIQTGVHDGDVFSPRGARVFSGSMRPEPNEEGLYRVTLVEVDEQGEVLERGLLVDGRWHVPTNEHAVHLAAIDLNAAAHAMCPQVARLWWDRMALSGRVSGVDFRWSADEGFGVEFHVEDVGLTLPIETAGLWARYRDGGIESSAGRPRMKVSSGAIRLSGDRVVLDRLEGELVSAETDADVVGVPYRVSVDIEDIPELDWENREAWMDDVLATAPFRMQFRADEFRVRREDGAAPAVELPHAVARALERFKFSDWILSTAVDVVRERPDPDAPEGEEPVIRSRGQAYITEGTGRYQGFPYPLDNVDAYIEFDNERITVHYLTGTGSDGATVRLSGSIAPPTSEGTVALRLTASDVPVDDRLRDALSEEQKRVFDGIVHHPSYDALVAAGLVRDAAGLERLADEIVELRQAARLDRLWSNVPGSVRIPGLRERLARIDDEIAWRRHLVDVGPFAPGGTVDLDLRIDRPLGPDRRAVTTGRVSIESFGIVYEHFPYPLTVEGGELEWRADRVVIAGPGGEPGLPIVTPGGGRGWLAGELAIVTDPEPGPDGRPRTRMHPDLTLTMDNDRVTELLYATIPPSSRERAEAVAAGWPGTALARSAEWLRDLALTGRLDYDAHVTADPSGALEYVAQIELAAGEADPGAAIAAALGWERRRAPQGWRLERCAGRITLTRHAIDLTSFTSAVGDTGARLEASGHLELGSETAPLSLHVACHDLEMSEQLVELLPSAEVEAARELWRRYHPEGRFDAELVYEKRDGVVVADSIAVRPAALELRIDEQTTLLEHVDGDLRIHDGQLTFDQLIVRLGSGEREDGLLVLGGALELGPDGDTEPARLRGTWTDGCFASPLIEEALRVAGAEDLVAGYRTYRPDGSFDAEFTLAASPGDEPPEFDLVLRPRAVSFQYHDTPIYLELDPGSIIRFAPGWITFDDVTCRHVGGRLDLAGVVSTAAPREATVRLGYEGRLMTSQLAAFLPRPVRRVVDAIDFQEGEASRLDNAVLYLLEEPLADGGRDWTVEFSGRIGVQDASFDAGLDFTGVHGPIDLTVARQPGLAPIVRVEPRPDEFRLLGHHLTNVSGLIELDDDGGAVLVRDLRAASADGAFTAEAKIGLGSDLDYDVRVRMAGVPLSDFKVEPATAVAGAESGPAAEPEPEEHDPPTGRVYASLDIGGRRGEPGSRYGRGVARVLGGHLAGVPLALQIMNVLQLTVPASGIDYADTAFYVAGDTLVFEDILFESTHGELATLRLIGAGQMSLDTFELETRFRSRSAIVGLSDLVGGLGDQFVAIEITGTLGAPEARMIALPGLSKPGPELVGAAPVQRGIEEPP